AVALDRDRLLARSRQEGIGTRAGLARPLLARAEDDPADAHVAMPLEEGQDRAAAADFNVVAVRTKAEHLVGRAGRFGKTKVKHACTPDKGKRLAQPDGPAGDTRRNASAAESASRKGDSSARPQQNSPPVPRAHPPVWRRKPGRGPGATAA